MATPGEAYAFRVTAEARDNPQVVNDFKPRTGICPSGALHAL
jgi:hypothetical protein